MHDRRFKGGILTARCPYDPCIDCDKNIVCEVCGVFAYVVYDEPYFDDDDGREYRDDEE